MYFELSLLMLSKLFGSNTRVELLKLFLVDQDRKYYIRELSRELDLHLNSVRRELNNLEQFGILISEFIEKEKDPNINDIEDDEDDEEDDKRFKKLKSSKLKQERKYYKVNADFPLTEETRSLIMKSYVLHKKDFIDKLKFVGNVKILVLTGIFTNDKSSSVDLLIVGEVNKNKLSNVIKKFENEMGREINYTTMGLEEFEYRRSLSDIFLSKILNSKKIAVIGEDRLD